MKKISHVLSLILSNHYNKGFTKELIITKIKVTKITSSKRTVSFAVFT